jgi:hypothetical protein
LHESKRAVCELHHDAIETFLLVGHIKETEQDRLVWPKDIAFAEREEERVCDLAGCTGDCNHDRIPDETSETAREWEWERERGGL